MWTDKNDDAVEPETSILNPTYDMLTRWILQHSGVTREREYFWTRFIIYGCFSERAGWKRSI